MTHDELERAMQFLLDSQARFFSDIEGLKESQKKTDIQIQTLTENVDALTENVEAMRLEMREAIENLIIANEVTRDLAQKVGHLAMNTNQRVTNLEKRVEILEDNR